MNTILSSALIILMTMALMSCSASNEKTDTTDTTDRSPKFTIAGYDYDRVSAIRDGKVSIEGADVSFEVSNIYSLNRSAFGVDQKYDISEIGLIPYISYFIIDYFRGYSFLTIFI
jgi:hypothetical protein